MNGKTTGRVARAFAVAVFFLVFVPGLGRAADIDFGVRGGFYSDADAGFLGVELLAPVTRQWYFNPNLEYVFVDDGSLWTGNLDFHYDFPTRNPYYLWAGGGAAVVRSTIDPPAGCRRCDSDSNTDLGLNLLAGVGFGKGQAIRPYVQGKVIISDNTEAVLGVGIRFY
jgi:hypothetical protein